MKKMITAVAVLVMASTLAIAGGKGEHGRHGKHGMRGGSFAEKFATKLNLTDAQKEQIRGLEANFRTENEAFFDTARETRKEYRQAVEAGDTAKVQAMKGTIDAQKAQMQQIRDAQHQRILSVLNADQRALFEAWKAEKGERGERGQRRGNRQ